MDIDMLLRQAVAVVEGKQHLVATLAHMMFEVHKAVEAIECESCSVAVLCLGIKVGDNHSQQQFLYSSYKAPLRVLQLPRE